MRHTSHRHQGFTLIEIMVVVTIIGILSGLVVMNIVTADPQKDLNREAQRLMAVLEMAQDEALFGRQDIGIQVTENSYSFARYGIPTIQEQQDEPSKLSSTNPNLGSGGSNSTSAALTAPQTNAEPEWLAIADEGEFRPYELSEDYEIVLEVDDLLIDPTGGKTDPDNDSSKLDDDNKIHPAIYISPSGEMTPFVLEIYLKDNSDIMVKVSGDESGRLWVGDDEEI